MSAAWTELERALTSWGSRVRDLPVAPRRSIAELVADTARYDFLQPRRLADLADEVSALIAGGTIHSTHPRYFGLFNPNVDVAGLIGDALAGIYNLQAGGFWCAPVSCALEERTLDWLRAKTGLPAGSAAHFTSGGSEANQTAVQVALSHIFPSYLDGGLAALPARPVYYASEEAHDSLLKIARTVGLGTGALRRIPSDAQQRMQLPALSEAVARDRAAGLAPFLVVGTAGTTATGAVDPLPELATLCARERLWLHVDAAWAGVALLSPRLRGELAGIEHADSITWDAHKGLPVPMGAGMFFCRHPAAVAAAFEVHTAYVPDGVADHVDLYARSLQWSRRAIGLKVFLTLAERGEAGVAALIDRHAHLGRRLRDGLVAAGFRAENRSALPLVCFTHPSLSASGIESLVRAVIEDGQAWLSVARRPGGDVWGRACITNHRTTEDDVDRLVAALARHVATLQ